MKALAAILPLYLLVVACGGGATSSDNDRAETTPAEQAAPTHLGGCILVEPVGTVPADILQDTGVLATDEYAPFTKKLTVYGITLVARDDASDEFLGRVAKTIKEIFVQDESLDLELQHEVIRNLYRYRATIPVPVGRDMSFAEEDEAAFDRLTEENSICDIIMQGVSPGQVMEVVEHILHFVSDMGLNYTFPDEWGISTDSALYQAMKRAIDEGYYVVEQYSDFDDEEEYNRVLLQEFAYWFITTAWDLQEPYGPIEAEWTIRNQAELAEKLPEFYEVFKQTVGRVMVPPSLTTLAEFGPTRAEEGER
jgi:hypothetical protein